MILFTKQEKSIFKVLRTSGLIKETKTYSVSLVRLYQLAEQWTGNPAARDKSPI